MKKVILATFALCTLLFIACNSESSGKNNTAPNNEMEHMETDAQHNETDHMTSGEVHEEHAMLNVKGSCEMCKDRIEKAAKEVEGVSFGVGILKTGVDLNYDLIRRPKTIYQSLRQRDMTRISMLSKLFMMLCRLLQIQRIIDSISLIYWSEYPII